MKWLSNIWHEITIRFALIFTMLILTIIGILVPRKIAKFIHGVEKAIHDLDKKYYEE